jgi:hypothetical protein
VIEWKDIRRNIVLLIVLCLLGLGFLIFVWPTPFLIVRDARGQVYRVNRFTGVREEATAKGWRTKEQIDAEYWLQQAREQEARQQKEADDKAAQQRKLDQIFADLKRIKVNSGRSELDRLILSNPTSWDLQGSSYNTTVEYYTRHKSSEEFLAKTQTTNSFLKAYSLNDFKLQEGTADLPSEVSSLPPGTAFLEKIFIQFDRATNRDTGETVWLKPAFVWKHERSWNIPQLDEP